MGISDGGYFSDIFLRSKLCNIKMERYIVQVTDTFGRLYLTLDRSEQLWISKIKENKEN